MAGFLDILGGLAQSGSQGATGALQGTIEGEGTRRKFQAQDIENSLRVLQQLSARQDLDLKGQAARNPTYKIGRNGEIYMIPPALGPQGPPSIVPGPQPLATDKDRALTEAALARAARDRAKTGAEAKPDFGTYLKLLNEGKRDEAEQFLVSFRAYEAAKRDAPPPSLVPPGVSVLPRGAAEPLFRAPDRPMSLAPNATMWDPNTNSSIFTAPPAPVSKIESFTDEKGRVRQTGNTYTPGTGKIDTRMIDLGAVGKPATSTTPKEATSFDALMAKAGDPNVPTEERARAKAQADSIKGGRIEIVQAGANVRDVVKQEQDARKVALKDKSADEKRQTVLADVERMRGLAGEINAAGLLPPQGATGVGVWLTDKKRAWLDPTNESLIAFRGLFGPIMIGEIDRGIFDEKGVRAIQAFKANFDMLDRMPSYQALDRFFKEVEGSIRSKMKEPSATSVPPQAVGGPAYTTPETGKQPPGGGPVIPKGARREGSEIISDSGKYVWRNGAWQPR